MTISLPRIWVFFYGTFMNANVLAEHGVIPSGVVPARLAGFDVTIRPRVNVYRTDRASVYGSIAAVTHDDLDKIYAGLEEDYGLKYLPEPVLAETLDGMLRPVLCYVAANMSDTPADPNYVTQLAECVRGMGHPEWYARHLESFARGSEDK